MQQDHISSKVYELEGYNHNTWGFGDRASIEYGSKMQLTTVPYFFLRKLMTTLELDNHLVSIGVTLLTIFNRGDCSHCHFLLKRKWNPRKCANRPTVLLLNLTYIKIFKTYLILETKVFQTLKFVGAKLLNSTSFDFTVIFLEEISWNLGWV